ncbi:Uncharacterised protein [Streptococcus pneumoniae]|nr:Uncharacterised protein [Streptococcus pneumoniae]CAG5903101.1 Uncharacterised protein [Streptococcus pneumoniae]CAG5942138.1 Uncharacterised protein [Streptococcus pneumoniae]CAG5949367.1 Uncharacterised protein [Streptococcus pneumoniae]CIW11570.1 Uncharacterised protein [Streptococcus pneumoniae]
MATCRTKVMVVNLPICPPASIPSAITASAPIFSMRLAKATLGTTGITIIPASWKRSIYLLGFPAPVVTTLTPSSITRSTISSTKGDKSMMLTPKGLSVNDLILSILALTTSFGAFPPPIIPNPPALETAPAKSPSATQAIPPWKIG